MNNKFKKLCCFIEALEGGFNEIAAVFNDAVVILENLTTDIFFFKEIGHPYHYSPYKHRRTTPRPVKQILPAYSSPVKNTRYYYRGDIR